MGHPSGVGMVGKRQKQRQPEQFGQLLQEHSCAMGLRMDHGSLSKKR